MLESEASKGLLTPEENCDDRGSMWVTLKERGLLFLKSRGLARLGADRRGALMVEYTVLIGAVGLAGAVGLILVGAAVARNFEFVRSMLLCPIP